MSTIDKKRKEFERQQVLVAKMGFELKIEEFLEQIERLKANIKIQDDRVKELDEQIEELSS